MKILYVGNFSVPHSTETHLAKTLENLGHQVTRVQEDPRYTRTLVDQTKGHDMFLFTRTWGNLVNLGHLEQLKQLGIPTVSYHLDLYVGLQRGAGIDTDPFWRTEYVFTPDGDPASQKYFEDRGINHYYLKPGVFKDECILLPQNGDTTLDGNVVFVGGGLEYGHPEWPYRHTLVRWLMDNYPNDYKKYGHPQRTVRNMDLNQLYSNAKIVIGDSLCLGFTHPYYWSDRVYETIGRGGFIIHPYIKGMEEEFTDGENIVFYEFNNFKQLKEKIDYYLSHDDERNRIRLAGHEYVKANSTYENRLKEVIRVVFGTADEEKASVPEERSEQGSQEVAPKAVDSTSEVMTALIKNALEYNGQIIAYASLVYAGGESVNQKKAIRDFENMGKQYDERITEIMKQYEKSLIA